MWCVVEGGDFSRGAQAQPLILPACFPTCLKYQGSCTAAEERFTSCLRRNRSRRSAADASPGSRVERLGLPPPPAPTLIVHLAPLNPSAQDLRGPEAINEDSCAELYS